MQISKISSNYNNTKQANVKGYITPSQTTFAGKYSFNSSYFNNVKKYFKPLNDLYAKGVEKIAKGIGKLLNTDTMYNLLEKTKNNKNLFNHLMTLASTVLSGLYVVRTLTNKSLEEKKRKTLAINQGIVFGFSTAMCYAVEGKMNSKVAEFADKFEAINFKLGKASPLLKKYKGGVVVASKIMIFDMIYRFIAPVIVTPIANSIGNRMQKNKEAKLLRQ